MKYVKVSKACRKELNRVVDDTITAARSVMDRAASMRRLFTAASREFKRVYPNEDPSKGKIIDCIEDALSSVISKRVGAESEAHLSRSVILSDLRVMEFVVEMNRLGISLFGYAPYSHILRVAYAVSNERVGVKKRCARFIARGERWEDVERFLRDTCVGNINHHRRLPAEIVPYSVLKRAVRHSIASGDGLEDMLQAIGQAYSEYYGSDHAQVHVELPGSSRPAVSVVSINPKNVTR